MDPASPLLAAYGLVVLAAGAFGVVLAVAPYRAFDLDRFFVPKELVLHATVLLLAVPFVLRARATAGSRTDKWLLAFLGVSLLSALLATNHWLAFRALALSWSSLLCFWSARALARGGRSRAIVGILCGAVALAAITSLLQAYGMDSPYFTTNRAPGGTLGNRNFVAHLAAMGAPLLLVSAVRARRWITTVAASVTLAVVAAALVLSRSRAAWLALGACVVVLLPAIWHARLKWRVPGMRRRIGIVALVTVGAVGLALVLPNKLDWRSDSPYLDTMKGVVNYKEGSGKGRLLQYRNTLRLAIRHPLLGVGPGNWPVEYPAIVPSSDPSLDEATQMTANPWPSSDWMAFLSERGLVGGTLLILAMLGMLGGAWRQVRTAGTLDDHLDGVALAGIVVATCVVGAFDAVLLLPAPAFIAWTAFGALRHQGDASPRAWSIAQRLAAAGAVLVVSGAAVARSTAQFASIADFSRGSVQRAERDDPGSYRIRLRAAELGAERGRCDIVRTQAGAAHDLFPNAPAPRRFLAACGVRLRGR
ncbi:MAG TPA: O-antigen ligase family protein [Gemmatimonadaceae bacterium]|nr:O-antigen ligase family protein [Gemmatimonadaceae bacterium]